MALLAATPLVAGDLSFTWNGSSGASGYRLYHGTGSGQYSGNADVGNASQGGLSNLSDCTQHYFAVTAYNSAGESGFSNEIAAWPRPQIGGASQSTAQRGDQFDLTLTGANFQAGSTIQFDNPEITVNSVSIASCNQLTVNVTVGASAPLGPAQITVTQPNGVAGAAAGLFSVIGQPLGQVQNLRRTDTQ